MLAFGMERSSTAFGVRIVRDARSSACAKTTPVHLHGWSVFEPVYFLAAMSSCHAIGAELIVRVLFESTMLDYGNDQPQAGANELE